MKFFKLFIIFVLLAPIIIFFNPPYVELNDLAIIQGVGVSCGDELNLYLKEIIPIKGDSGIKYQYEYYQGMGNSVFDSFQNIQLKTKKKLYLKKAKFLVTDCTKSNKIIDSLSLNDLKIYHVKEDVFNKLKEVRH